MKCPFTSKETDGFTLVELLVTILIIVILAVTMLPALKPFVVKAQYAAEAVPVIGNIRTKVELYRIDKDHVPGIPLDANGNAITNAPIAGLGSVTIHSDGIDQLPTSPIGIQSMAGIIEGEEGSTTNWTGSLTWFEAEGPVTVPSDMEAFNASALTWHAFAKGQADVRYDDLTGRRLRPTQFEYVVPYCDGENYCYALGCFGDGTLAKGTGYAVLEFNNSLAKVKFVAVFERYKAESSPASQMMFYVEDGAWGNAPTADSVIIPTLQGIVDAAEDAVKAQKAALDFKQALASAGWDVQ